MRSFRSRILVLVLALVIAPLVATIYALTRKADDAATSQATTELRAAATVARESLKFHGQQLSQAAQVLTADYAFKEAIAAGDHNTILSVLDNHGARLHADLLAAFDLDNQLLGTANRQLSSSAIILLSDNLQRTALNSDSYSYSIIDGIPYLLVSATVRAPKPIARVILGFAISEALTRDIAQIVGTDVSFIARSAQQNVIVVTSNPHTNLDPATELEMNKDAGIHRINARQEHFLVQREVLPATNGTLLLELIEPLSRAAKTYTELQTAILLIGGSASLIALVLGFWLTRAATRPIGTLTDAAERIEQGDYSSFNIDRTTTEFRKLGTAFASMCAAVSEREQRILYQSQHDKLTGLPNYDALQATLTSRINAKTDAEKPISLILVDLLQFADLNAALGHSIGDRVLREVAYRLTNKFSHSGMVARVGSKQFMLMLPDTDTVGALLLAHETLHLLQQPLFIGDIPITIHARCGVACFPHHGMNAEELLRRTDLALLQAQQSDSSIACFDSVTEEKHQRRIQVLGDLQRAINENQLQLVYQPKMNMADRSIAGCETLVRWRHPVYGNVSPAEFIPHAERTGSIRQLTRWVLNTALKQLAEWQQQARSLSLAINLSAADIADVNLPNDIMQLLKKYNVAANQLMLEITESTVMKNTDTALHAISQLRLHGIKFSIDDFGTGHSSLAQLRRLPVDELKLEGSLVADLIVEERARVIARAMTELSHSLGMRVVAEGIETVQMLRAVGQSGCDIAQGYLIAKPLGAAELSTWLDTQTITSSLGNAISNQV
ncbi:MAG: EAL domain-containing protein, partial [Steroidobacter sp.]